MLPLLDSIKWLHELYTSQKNAGGRKQFLQSVIRAETKVNADLLEVIAGSKPADLAKTCPAIFAQLDIRSYELLIAAGVGIAEVFDTDTIDPEQLAQLERSRTRFEDYLARPSAELYEYVIRKVRLLHSLAQAEALERTNIRLGTRCANLARACRALAVQLDDNTNQ